MKTFTSVKSRSSSGLVSLRVADTFPAFANRRARSAAVRQILRGPRLQTKLTIGAPDDIYEQEADRLADEVMRMPEPRVQTLAECSPGGCSQVEEETIQPMPLSDQITPRVQRQVEEEEEEELIQAKAFSGTTDFALQRQPEEEEEELLQPKSVSGNTPEVTPNVASTIGFMQGGGQPLSLSERAFYEPRFGYDFSQVRIHRDPMAAAAARALNAQAFTVGNHIIFATDRYSPQSHRGRSLLAHELSHVIQQTGPLLPFHMLIQKTPVGEPEELTRDDTFEAEMLNLARTSNIVRDLEEKAIQFKFEFGGLIFGNNSYTDLIDKKIYIRGDRSLEDAVLDYAHELQNATNQERINSVYDKFEGGEPTDASAFAEAILKLDIEGLITKAEVARELRLDIFNIEDTFILTAQRLADKYRDGKISEEKYRKKLKKIVERTGTIDGLSPREHYEQLYLDSVAIQRKADDKCADVNDDPFLRRPEIAVAVDEAWSRSRKNEPYSAEILDAFNRRRMEEFNRCLQDESKTAKDCEGGYPEENRPEYRGRRFREVGFFVDSAGKLSDFYVAELPWKVSIPVSPNATAVFHTHPPKQTSQVQGAASQVSMEDLSALWIYRGENKRFYVIERDSIDLIALQSDQIKEGRILRSWSRRDVRKCVDR